MDKKVICLGAAVGGMIGGYLPVLLWHANGFDASSILGGVVGTIAGIIAAYKVSQ